MVADIYCLFYVAFSTLSSSIADDMNHFILILEIAAPVIFERRAKNFQIVRPLQGQTKIETSIVISRGFQLKKITRHPSASQAQLGVLPSTST